jgi:hypothetical protein
MHVYTLNLGMHSHTIFFSLYKRRSYLFSTPDNFYDLIFVPVVNKL